jgi:hypothetical protein
LVGDATIIDLVLKVYKKLAKLWTVSNVLLHTYLVIWHYNLYLIKTC